MGGPATINGEPVESTDKFFMAPFVLDGIEWPTCEHYYQAAKYLLDAPVMSAHIEKIRFATSGEAAWSLGQRYREHLRPDWEHVKANVMYRAVAAKYATHVNLAEDITATRGSIKASWSTADWQHLNGLILERVREELRPPEQRNLRRLAALVSLTEPKLQGLAALESLSASLIGRAKPPSQIEPISLSHEEA